MSRGGGLLVTKAVRLVLALACVAFVGSLATHAQAQGPPPAVPMIAGTGAITGIVVDVTSGRPIGGATVRLDDRRTGMRSATRQQVTTPKGRFAFVDLPPVETYFLTVSKGGYLDGGYGRPDPRGASAPITLTEGQWLGEVRMTLAKPGSISGAVLDERGEPVVGANVRVLPQIMLAGRPQWVAGPIAWTDDRGVYRIAGLGPGKYVVSVPSVQATLPIGSTLKPATARAGTSMADLQAASDAGRAEKLLVDVGGGQQLVVGRFAVPPAPAADGQRRAYPITFFPGTSTPADASVIELRAGEDRVGVDLALQPVRTARISGALQGPAEAIGNQLLRLMPVGLEELGQGSEAATTVSAPDGRFSFFDVPNGSYKLELRHTIMELAYISLGDASTAPPAPVQFPAQSASGFGVKAAPNGMQGSALNDWLPVKYWGELRLDVADRDIDSVVLPLHRPVTLSGTVAWAPGSTAATTSLYLESARGLRSMGMPSVLFPQGSAFTIDGLMAGDYILRVRSATVESVMWEGRDYAERPLPTSAGRDLAGVVVTLSSATSTATGNVSDGNGPLTSLAAVIAYPVEQDGWTDYGFNPARLSSVLATADGRFRFEGLPPAEYFFLAVPAAQERAWLDPAFLAAHAGVATRVRIERSDAKVQGIALRLAK